MSSRNSREHDLDAERKRRATLLPPNTACEACGETDPMLLDADLCMVLCADDAAINRRLEANEEHHFARRRWNIVLDLTPNWHRVLTALQRARESDEDEDMAELLFALGDFNYALGDYLRHREQRGERRGKRRHQNSVRPA